MDTRPEILAFFESYAVAFESLDAAIIAAHFAYPAHITSDAGTVTLMTVADKAAWAASLTQLLQMYRAVGVSKAHLVSITTTEISPRLVHAAVRWALADASGQPLYEFDALYTLAESEGTLRISTIAHNEVPQLRACFARVKARRAGTT